MTTIKIIINGNEHTFETKATPLFKAILEMRKSIWKNYGRKQRFHAYDIKVIDKKKE